MGGFKQAAPAASPLFQQAPAAFDRRSDARESQRAPPARLIGGNDGRKVALEDFAVRKRIVGEAADSSPSNILSVRRD